MICCGRDGLYPTIHFERCREGAEDFYLYQTLWNAIGQKRSRGAPSAALDAAAELLEGAAARVTLNQRTPPQGLDADELKARVVAALECLGS